MNKSLKPILGAVGKEPWQIVSSEFLDLSDWKLVLRNRKLLSAGEPVANPTLWDSKDPEPGTWMWNRDSHQEADLYLSQLVEIDLAKDTIFSQHSASQEFKADFELAVSHYSQFTWFYPLEGYQTTDGEYVVENGRRRLFAARLAGIQKLLMWVKPTDGVHCLTRKAIIDKAVADGKFVPPEVMYEYQQGFGSQNPPFAYDFTLSQKRRALYPTLGEQLGAMFLARQGDGSALKLIDSQIAAARAKYPKPKKA